MHTWANPDGTQRIEDTGPLTKKRMETVDEEFRDAAVDFIRRQHEAQTPFFVWFNATHMHFRTHPKPESIGRAGRWQSEYHDTMLDHDDLVGDLLDLLDELGIADNTIVMYSTDNGPHMNSWPDAGMTPYRNEKNSNWEGAYRVPAMVRWPARIPAGRVLNGIVSHNDWFVTLLSAVGVPRYRRAACAPERTWAAPPTRCTSTGTTSWPTSPARPTRARASTSSTSPTTATSPRCATTTGSWCSRSNAAPAPCEVWAEPFTDLRIPKIFNLRTDPYERADITSNTYYDWLLDHAFMAIPAQAYVAADAPNVRRVPATAEVRKLQPRPGDHQAAGDRQERLTPEGATARLADTPAESHNTQARPRTSADPARSPDPVF